MEAVKFLCAFFGAAILVLSACGSGSDSRFDGSTGGDGDVVGDGGSFVCNPPCGQGQKCSSLMRCIPVDDCDTTSDCPTAGTQCDPMTHKCVPGGGCGGSVIQGALVAPN